MSDPQPDFTGIAPIQDPGVFATGTVPSAKIPEWITQNVPAPAMSSAMTDMFALRGETPGPWRLAGDNFQAPTASVLDRILGTLSGGMYTPTAIPQEDFPAKNPLLVPKASSVSPPMAFDPVAAEAQAIRAPESYKLPTPLGSLDVPTDPVELALMAGGAAAGGVTSLRSAEEGWLRSLLRTRLGGQANMEEVAAAVQRTAPIAMRPATATREGISDTVRQKVGIRAVGAAKQTSDDAIASELNAITAQQRAAANALPTNLQRQLALQRVRDRATEFKTLTTELADAGRMTFDPATGQMRNSVGALASGRTRDAVYQEIEQLLTPDQFRRFMATQTDYAKAAILRRLFNPKGQATDVLLDRQALQKRAKFLLDEIDPELLRTIFRGGGNVGIDTSVGIPLGLGTSGARSYLKAGGTVLSGPVSRGQLIGSGVVGGATGALGAQQAGRALAPHNPFVEIPLDTNPYVDDPSVLRDLFGLSLGGDTSWAAFLRNLNPFIGAEDPSFKYFMGGR